MIINQSLPLTQIYVICDKKWFHLKKKWFNIKIKYNHEMNLFGFISEREPARVFK